MEVRVVCLDADRRRDDLAGAQSGAVVPRHDAHHVALRICCGGVPVRLSGQKDNGTVLPRPVLPPLRWILTISVDVMARMPADTQIDPNAVGTP